MSGGSYDYAYRHVEDMAGSLRRLDNPLRRAFADHLMLVAKAMHAIEWVDSCDYAAGDEDEKIRRVIAPGTELVAAIKMAERAHEVLGFAIDAAHAARTSDTSRTDRKVGNEG